MAPAAVFKGGTFEVELISILPSPALPSPPATQVISSGLAIGAVFNNSALQIIDGGVDSAATFLGGTQVISGNGSAYDDIIGSGGVQSNFGASWDTNVNASGQAIVELGGVASGAQVQSQGSETVGAGGEDFFTVVEGGTQVVLGIANAATINAGSQVISAGGEALGTLINGGTQLVESNGSAQSTNIYVGSQVVSSAGTAQNTTVYGGALVIEDFGSANIVQVSGGTLELDGTAAPEISQATVFSGGTLELVGIVAAGGIPDGVTLSSGSILEAGDGSVIANYVVSSGFTLAAGPNGGVNGAAVQSSGNLLVSSAGAGVLNSISNGGTETVSSGGFDRNGKISGGEQDVYGSASGTTIYAGSQVVEYGGVASATVISGGTMELAVGGAVNGGINLAGGSGTLQIDGNSMPTNTISGFAAGDTIDLPNIPFVSGATAVLSGGNELVISVGGQSYDLQLDPNQIFSGVQFVPAQDSGTGTQVTEEALPCYCAGTLISTARGDVPVEELAIGDEVLTLSGELRRIKWIGQRSYRQPFMARSVMPILIKAGALREHVPLRDLYVSPEHAMYLDEVLVPAERLVNGASIIRCAHVATVQYFHIELDSHDVIFAEGAPAETFVVCGNRLMFHNAAEFAELYPGDSAPGWAFCAPRVDSGPVLEEIQRAIAQRAGLAAPDDPAACGPLDGYFDDASHNLINGWAFDPSHPDVPVWLEVLVNDGVIGRVLADKYRPDVTHISDGFHGFALWLQQGLSPLVRHVIRVRRAADGCELPGSPRVLEPRDVPDFLRSPELVPALRTAALSAADDAALDAMLDSLRAGINEVRQVRAQREMESAETNAPAQLLRRSKRGPVKARRALVIDDRLPDATRDAGSNAVLGHMRALMALGYRVEFVPARQSRKDAVPSDRDLAAIRWHRVPAVTSVEDVLRRNADAFELIYLHRLSNAMSYAGLARQWCPQAQIVYSVADLHHQRLARQAELQALPQLLARAQSVKQSELLAMRSVDVVITHSTAEAEYLFEEAPGVRTHVVPWPLTPAPCNTPLSARSGLAFIGSVAQDPNVDAVVWLLEHIMPRVWRRDPSITCRIVGAGWPNLVRGHLDRRVQMVGAVAQLATVFDQVRLTVAPLRFGAGIKGKVLESFAAGVPCAMTPIAAEGLALTPSLRTLIGQNPDQIANLIWRLHKDVEFNTKTARAGLRLIARDCSTEKVCSALRGALAITELQSAPSRPRRAAVKNRAVA